MRRWREWYSLALFILSLVLIILFLRHVGKSDFLAYMSKFSPVLLFLLTMCVFMRVFFSALAFQTGLKVVGEELPLLRTFKIRLISFSIGYVTPSASFGGEPFAALLASDKEEYEKVFAATIFYRVVEGIAGLSIQTVGFFVLLFEMKVRSQPLFVVLGGLWIIVFLIGVVWKSGKTPLSKIAAFLRLSKAFVKKMKNFEETFSSIFSAHPRAAARIFLLSCVSLGFSAFKYWLALLFLQGEVASLFTILALYSSYAFLLLGFAVPGFAGIFEVSQLTIFTLLRYPPELGITISLLFRLTDTPVVLTGLSLFAVESLRRKANYLRR